MRVPPLVLWGCPCHSRLPRREHCGIAEEVTLMCVYMITCLVCKCLELLLCCMSLEVACSPLLLTTLQVGDLELLILGFGACRVDAGLGSFLLFLAPCDSCVSWWPEFENLFCD